MLNVLRGMNSHAKNIRGPRGIGQARPKNKARLGVEVLEDRLAPATFRWNSGVLGGNWSNAANWLDDNNMQGVPGAMDTVRFTNLNNTISTLDAGFQGTVQAIELEGYTATLTLARTLTVTTFKQDGGTIEGDFSITVNGSGNWVGGTLRGSGNPTNSTLVIANGATFDITGDTGEVTLNGRWIQNSGTINWMEDSTITATNGGAVNNQSGATIDVNAGDMTFAGNGAFFNSGTVKVQDETTCTISVPLTNYRGSYEVEGQLTATASASFLGTAANADTAFFSGGGIINFTSGFQAADVISAIASLQFNGGATVTGSLDILAGTVEINNGLTLSGALTNGAGCLIHWAGGNIVLNGGIFVNNGDMRFETGGTISGTGQFENKSWIILDSPAPVTVSATFINDRTLSLRRSTLIFTDNWSQGARLRFRGGNLQVNGNFTNSGDIELWRSAQIAADTFTNDGDIDYDHPFANPDVMRTLTVAPRPNVAGGNFTQGANATLFMRTGNIGANDRLVAAGTVTLGGTLEMAAVAEGIPLNWSWELITGQQRQGQFATVNQDPAFIFTAPSYTPTSVWVNTRDLVPPGPPQFINEDVALVFGVANNNAIGIPAVDPAGGLLQIAVSVADGTLTLGSTSGLNFSSGTGYGESSMTFVGTVDAINAAFEGMTFNPTSNFNGSSLLQITTSDVPGSGGTFVDNDVVLITVNPVNDAPTGSDATISMIENSTLTFSASHFGFNDSIDGNGFMAVLIQPLLFGSVGTLYFNGSEVTEAMTISVADIGLLTYMPPEETTGLNLASFLFKVQDDGGIADGGVDTDTIWRSLTIEVLGVVSAG